MQTMTDDEIIRSVKNGRTQDFEILIDRYRTRIVNFIFRMIMDYDEAMNISQDVFFKIFKKINGFREQDNFQAFIFTIAKNMTLNYLKKSRRTVSFSSLFGRAENNIRSDSESDGQSVIEREESENIVEKGLRNLNEEQRLALIMKIYLRMSYRKICDITGWSEPKVETLISRAKKNLKDYVRMQENGV